MKFLVTGGSGFLGRYILDELTREQHDVTCIVRNRRADSEGPSYVQCDLSEDIPTLGKTPFQTIIHAAGRAHIMQRSPKSDAAFISTNCIGTQHLIESLERLDQPPTCFIYISSVAVYGRDAGENIDETTPLAGNSSYAISKIKSEDIVGRWCKEHQVNYYHLRLPLVAGDDPPGNLGHLMQAIKKGKYVHIRDNDARKSVVIAEEVARFIPTLGKQPSGAYNLCCNYHPTFNEIETAILKAVDGSILLSLNKTYATWLGRFSTTLNKLGLRNSIGASIEKISSTLTFLDAKARKDLNWSPEINILEFLSTIKMHRQ